MDIGGFRDMHRHRRCTQIIQGFTAQHGYETPGAGDLPAGPENDFDILAAAGVLADYRSAIESAHQAAAEIAAGPAPEAAQSAQYLFPLATRIRALFKMDFAEAQYIYGAAFGPRRPLQLPPRGLGDVFSPSASASSARKAHPGNGLYAADRSVPKVKKAGTKGAGQLKAER